MEYDPDIGQYMYSTRPVIA